MSKNTVLVNGGAMPESDRRAEYNFISKVHFGDRPMITDRRSFIGGSDARPVGLFKRHWHIGIYFERLRRRRTPAPPPFSGMNSTPAFSSALWTANLTSSDTLGPSRSSLSSRLIVGRDRPAASASWVCDQPSRPRAARICSIEIMQKSC
jgi:hypothetical protein